MKRFISRYPWLIATILGILFITAMRQRTRYVPDAPEVLYSLPTFQLVDQDGKQFSSSSLQGRVWIAGFFFTQCPSICPRITRAMLDLQQRYQQQGINGITLISFSVDPENDTSEVLKRYAETMNLDQTTWRLVTGPRAEMEELVVGGFKLAMDPQKSPENPTMYDIAHATKLVIIDENGGVRGYYDTDEQGLDEIFHRSQHVLREQNKN